jgi:hypothetical protein
LKDLSALDSRRFPNGPGIAAGGAGCFALTPEEGALIARSLATLHQLDGKDSDLSIFRQFCEPVNRATLQDAEVGSKVSGCRFGKLLQEPQILGFEFLFPAWDHDVASLLTDH